MASGIRFDGERVSPQGLKPLPSWLVLVGTAESRALPDYLSIKNREGHEFHSCR